jgi:hypothetical protein
VCCSRIGNVARNCPGRIVEKSLCIVGGRLLGWIIKMYTIIRLTSRLELQYIRKTSGKRQSYSTVMATKLKKTFVVESLWFFMVAGVDRSGRVQRNDLFGRRSDSIILVYSPHMIWSLLHVAAVFSAFWSVLIDASNLFRGFWTVSREIRYLGHEFVYY